MDLLSEIKNSITLMNWLNAQIDTLTTTSIDKHYLEVGCLEMASEHHRGIVMLIDNQIYGSAFALRRVQFEALVNGIWLYFCASTKDKKNYKKGKSPEFGTRLNAVEEIDIFKSGILGKIKNHSYGTMNDYTHTGINQISRRFSENYVESNYDSDEIIYVIKQSNLFVTLSAMVLCLITDEAELLKKISEYSNKLTS